MALPTNLPWDMADDKWAAELNPLLAMPQLNGTILNGVVLKAGTNNIDHKLGRKLQGWQIVDQDAAAQIFRSRPITATTLTLNSTARTVVSLLVF